MWRYSKIWRNLLKISWEKFWILIIRNLSGLKFPNKLIPNSFLKLDYWALPYLGREFFAPARKKFKDFLSKWKFFCFHFRKKFRFSQILKEILLSFLFRCSKKPVWLFFLCVIFLSKQMKTFKNFLSPIEFYISNII